MSEEIRSQWIADGCPPCDHSSSVKDRMRYGGGDSGDRLCQKCGAQWYMNNVPPPEPGGCPDD